MAAMIFLDFQNFFIFILLGFFSLFSYSVFFRKRKDSRGYNLIPSPPSVPVIGHLHLLLSFLTHKSLQEISSKYGPLLLLRIFGYPIVLVSSPSMAYEMFKMHDANISSRIVASGNAESLVFGSSGFITARHGDYWKFMKKLVAMNLLRPQVIKQSRDVRAEEIERFYFGILDKATKKEIYKVCKEAMKLTNNMICRMSMGRSCSEENGEAQRILEVVLKSFAVAKKMFFSNLFHKPLKKVGISLFRKEIMGVSDEFDELLERILVEHEEKLGKHHDKDMMDMLLEAHRDEHAEYKITRNQIKSLFVELFLGGTDTSAQTLQWTLAEIINHPNTIKILREEIDSVVGKTRLVQETDLPKLPYLQAVVKEGLRLHPPGPLLIRTFDESCEFKEFYIPKETTLFINIYAMMRDPGFWEDPDEFKPERFLTSSKSEREDEIREQALKFIPFGSGRRACPGENIAYIFLGTAIGMMVQCFDWRIDGEKVNMDEAFSGMNLAMADPLKCIPVVRIDPFKC